MQTVKETVCLMLRLKLFQTYIVSNIYLNKWYKTYKPTFKIRNFLIYFISSRVNIVYRLEMVERELEDGRMTMDKLRKRFDSAKFLLQVEEENLKIEMELLANDSRTLEAFIVDNSDKKTGRLYHDKYLR